MSQNPAVRTEIEFRRQNLEVGIKNTGFPIKTLGHDGKNRKGKKGGEERCQVLTLDKDKDKW